jgi:hypothetical protein
VVEPYPSEKSWSAGMIIPNLWKNKNVPNHQPDDIPILWMVTVTEILHQLVDGKKIDHPTILSGS